MADFQLLDQNEEGRSQVLILKFILLTTQTNFTHLVYYPSKSDH